MADLRVLLTRAREALEPFAHWADVSSDELQVVMVTVGQCKRARALHAEITTALAEDSTPPNSLDDPVASQMAEAGSGRVVGFESQPEAPSKECPECGSNSDAHAITCSLPTFRGQPAPDDGWRDISTAPRDEKIEIRGTQGGMGRQITHWRPLPLPPAERECDSKVAPCDDAEFGMKP